MYIYLDVFEYANFIVLITLIINLIFILIINYLF